MKIGPFVSYIKWPGELGSIGCTFIVCFLPFVRLNPQGHFNCTLLFSWNLSFFLLAQVCYTADCNVLTLQQSSCSSTLPIFVPQTKDGPYLLPYKAARRRNSTMNLQQTDLSTWRIRIISIKLANWEKQC